MKKLFLSGALMLAAVTANAQYLHITTPNGSMDIKCDTILSMVVDNEAPPRKVTIDGKTYTLTVGGTVGEAVDLGLSVKWASHNIGASQPEEYGAYLAWGEVGTAEEHYTDGIKSNYSWSSYKYCKNGSWTGITKYTFMDVQTSGIWYSNGTFVGDGKTELEAMDDAAAFNWGGDWRMPTYEELKELRNMCTWRWITTDVKDASGNFIKGYKVVGPNRNSIFLPASGNRGGSSLYGVGSWGFFWSSSLDTSLSYGAYDLDFGSSNDGWLGSNRDFGFSVRPVRAQN